MRIEEADEEEEGEQEDAEQAVGYQEEELVYNPWPRILVPLEHLLVI